MRGVAPRLRDSLGVFDPVQFQPILSVAYRSLPMKVRAARVALAKSNARKPFQSAHLHYNPYRLCALLYLPFLSNAGPRDEARTRLLLVRGEPIHSLPMLSPAIRSGLFRWGPLRVRVLGVAPSHLLRGRPILCHPMHVATIRFPSIPISVRAPGVAPEFDYRAGQYFPLPSLAIPSRTIRYVSSRRGSHSVSSVREELSFAVRCFTIPSNPMRSARSGSHRTSLPCGDPLHFIPFRSCPRRPIPLSVRASGVEPDEPSRGDRCGPMPSYPLLSAPLHSRKGPPSTSCTSHT